MRTHIKAASELLLSFHVALLRGEAVELCSFRVVFLRTVASLWCVVDAPAAASALALTL
jgi:hypothetical protein